MTLPTAPDEPSRTLQRNACSLAGGIALAAAAMAPALAVVLNAPAAAPAAGRALPLSFLIAFLVCLFVGNTVVAFARRLATAYLAVQRAELESLAGLVPEDEVQILMERY